MQQEIRRTIQIKLRQTPEQAEEIEKLFSAFKLGLNFSLKQVEEAYQRTISKYERVEDVDGVCAACGKERPLIYSYDGILSCNSCVMREYSEYTVRSAVIGTANRPVAKNIKDAVDVENLTHVHMMFSQAYGTWKSFNAWRNKREFERSRLENDLAELKANPETVRLYRAAYDVWERAAHIQRDDKKTTRRTAMAMASREIYGLYSDILPRDISRTVNKIRELRFRSHPVHFPEYETVTSVQMHKNFVNFEDGKLHISLFHKKNNRQEMDYYRNAYLDQFLAAMQEDNAVYTNLIKRVDGKRTDYYMMYPLTVIQDIPAIFDLADVFTICFSPDSILVHGRYNDGNKTGESPSLSNLKKEKSLIPVTEINSDGQSLVWFRLGSLLHAKNHYSEKRTELMEHNTRNSLRRIKKMGNAELRSTRTFNHQLSHAIVEYIADRSENPLIAMWDMTSGITADYGKRLNRTKKLWPVVQQQEFITHKAFLRCVPVRMIPYKKENVLTCSSCHEPFLKKDEFGKPLKKETIKTITALLRRIHNLKCEKCGGELNMLINQARNISPLAKEAKL